MKKNYLMKGAFAALLLTNTMASAQTEYPASDFQPKVVYKDSEYINKHQQATGAGTAQVDSKYPAASFQPKVLYKDPNYKPSKMAQAAPGSATPSAAVEPLAGTDNSVGSTEEKEDSSFTFLIGLVIAGAVGFFLLKKQPEAKAKQPHRRPRARQSVAASAGGELTGVAKYLSEMEISNTGVSRYLEKQKQTPVSSVAKYLAKQVLREREAAASKVTGVEKYLRDRG